VIEGASETVDTISNDESQAGGGKQRIELDVKAILALATPKSHCSALAILRKAARQG